MTAPANIRYIDQEYAALYTKEYIPRFGKHFALLLWKSLKLNHLAPLQLVDLSASHGFPSVFFLKKLHADSRIIAISQDFIALRYLHYLAGKEDNQRIFGRYDDVSHLPLASNYFDAGYINLAYDAVSNLALAMKELARVTKPGGLIALVSPLAGSLGELYDLVGNVLVALGAQQYLSELMANRLDAATIDSMQETMRLSQAVQIKTYRSSFNVLLPAGAYISTDALMQHFLLRQIMRNLPNQLQQEVFGRLSTIRATKPFNMHVIAACCIGLAPNSTDDGGQRRTARLTK